MRHVPFICVAGAGEEPEHRGDCFAGAASDNLLGDLLHRVQESKGITWDLGISYFYG